MIEGRRHAQKLARQVAPEKAEVVGMTIRVADERVKDVHGSQGVEGAVRNASRGCECRREERLLGGGPEGDVRCRGIVHERADRGQTTLPFLEVIANVWYAKASAACAAKNSE